MRQIAVGVRPGSISAGAGAVWVANLDDDTISEINPSSLRVLSTRSTGRSVAALAAGDGAVWTVDSAHETAMRIDPAFHDVVRARRVGPDEPGGAIPSPIAVAGGEVWAATRATRAAAGRPGGLAPPRALTRFTWSVA